MTRVSFHANQSISHELEDRSRLSVDGKMQLLPIVPLVAAERPVHNDRSIPSLDGLRALSVLAVVLGHTQSAFLDRIPFNRSFRNGSQGVAVFFTISGLLITHLLLKEIRRTGGTSLKRFYLRRTFRIFPPFYVFLLVIAVLGLFHKVDVNGRELIAAATYTWNYTYVLNAGRILGHCWSLSLEEQFYLLWPLCMAFFSKRTNLWIAGGVILLSPLSRIITYIVWPQMRGQIFMMLHTHLDAIMTGCLLALTIDLELWSEFRKRLLHPVIPFAAIVFLLVVDKPAELHWGGKYMLPAGYLLEDIAIALIVLYVIFRHESIPGKILNLKFMRHVGTISYGIYLWQQLFTGPDASVFPVNIIWIIVCAELSFFLIEKPSYRVRDFVQRKYLLPA
jgi:peptidoglycan/LPS O-acetylase OafA/YrhL